MMGESPPISALQRSGSPRFFAAALVLGLAFSCGCREAGKPSAPAKQVAPERAAPAVKAAKTPPAKLAGAATLLDAANLSTAATQGELDRVRARLDELTAGAESAVVAIEEKPPTRAQLIQLDAAFSDAKRSMMIDPELARMGNGLDPAARAAIAAYTKRRHAELMQRLKLAGQRHRSAKTP